MVRHSATPSYENFMEAVIQIWCRKHPQTEKNENYVPNLIELPEI